MTNLQEKFRSLTKLKCEICGGYFDSLNGLYNAETGEEIQVCPHDCFNKIARHNKSVCNKCNVRTYPCYKPIKNSVNISYTTSSKCPNCRYHP